MWLATLTDIPLCEQEGATLSTIRIFLFWEGIPIFLTCKEMTDMKVQKERESECVRAWKPDSFGKYTFHSVEVFQED